MSDSIVTEDPTIINAEPLNPSPEGYLTTDEEPTELSEVSFEAAGVERTLAVGDALIADTGAVVGEVDRITRRQQDTSKRYNIHEEVHTVWIDYSKGTHHGDSEGTGGVHLGETAKQMADGDMTTKR
jgi:hypothetical protein